MMSPTLRFEALTSLVIKTSPGLAYGRILPVRIGEMPTPACECKIAGPTINVADTAQANTLSRVLTRMRGASLLGVATLFMA